jgi:hypothetical protein
MTVLEASLLMTTISIRFKNSGVLTFMADEHAFLISLWGQGHHDHFVPPSLTARKSKLERFSLAIFIELVECLGVMPGACS